MTPTPTKKTGILLLNMGGPAGLDSVQPFLYNLFSDPDIIKLPLSFLLQKPLAWFISTSRKKEAQHNYSLMGGASPQLPLTQEQANHLQAALKQQGYGDLPVYLAMRYWHPLTHETIDHILADGIEHLIVLSMYPHFSYTTTGSSMNELRRVLAAKAPHISMSVIAGYALDAGYLDAVTEGIKEGLNTHPWDCPKEKVRILFSAHSLPERHVKRTKDPYPDHIFRCIKTLMETRFPGYEWGLCYQSKVGNMPWLGPYTDSALRYYAASQMDNILIVPISFVTDHIETLVEIDLQYIALAKEIGIRHCYRAPSLNSRPRFIETLARLVGEKLDRLTQ